MAKGTAFDVDDASVVRVMEGLRSVLKAGTAKETRKRVGDAAIKIIKERTQEQRVDSKEQHFREYAASYVDYKSWFLGRNIQASNVDLTLTGHMFSALKRKIEGLFDVRLFFDDSVPPLQPGSRPGEIEAGGPLASQKAEAHHLGIGQKKRRFFAVGEEPAEIILFEKIIRRATQERINILSGVFQ